jgi:hypothetical protein
MTPYQIIYRTDGVYPIKLAVPTWQVLLWKSAQSTADLIALRAQQFERQDEDLKKTVLH